MRESIKKIYQNRCDGHHIGGRFCVEMFFPFGHLFTRLTD